MLEQVLMNLKNWFLVPGGIHEDTYTIKDGGITLPFLQNGQYFRICGSVFNDGIYQYPTSDLKNETFDGTVWALSVPKAVINLAEEIEAWETKNGDASRSPFASESFGGYSYTKQNYANANNAATWQSVFRQSLNAWRKI